MQATQRAIFERAEIALEAGQYQAAFALYSQLMLGWLAASDPAQAAVETLRASEMVALERVADLAALFADWDNAARVLDAMESLFAQAANPCAASYIALKAVALELNRGQPERADARLQAMSVWGDRRDIEFTERGFCEWEAGRDWENAGAADRIVLLSRFYLETGRMEASRGEYERARAALKRGIAHCRPGAPQLAEQALGPLWLAMAQAELEYGDLASAEVALQSVPTAFDGTGQPGLAVQRLELRGKLELLRGKLGAARTHYTDALTICERGKLEAGALLARLNLAQVLIYLNQTRQATEQLQRARDVALRLEDAALRLRAESLLRLASARGQSLADAVPIAASVIERWGAAAPSAPAAVQPEATPIYETLETNSFLTSFESCALGFHWYLGEWKLAEAAQYLDEITQVFSGTDSLLIGVRLLVMESMVTYYQADYARARQGFQEARPLLQHLGLLPELWQVQRFISWCLAQMGRARETELARREAEQTLAALTGTLSAAEQAVFLLNKWTAEEEYISGEINQLVRWKKAAEQSPRWQRPWLRWQLRQRLGALLDYVDRHKSWLAEREVKGGNNQNSLVTKSLLWRLLKQPRDAQTFVFVVLPDRVLVIKVGWLSLEFGVSPLTRLQVREAVRQWHELVLAGTPLTLREAQRIAQTLTDGLQISGLLTEMSPRVQRLIFVPDDSLHGLPCAALRYQDRYLIEQYALSLAYEWSPTRPAPKAQDAGPGLTVGIAAGAGEYPLLPQATDEAQCVGQWMARQGITVTMQLNEAATKPALLTELATARFFHIACHGTFQPNQPDRSGLVLLAGQQADVLSLRELSGLHLPHLQLAVLSACWSADSFVLPGRWVITLPETFWRAGAESILGCLWEVDDRVAKPFMEQFYCYLETMPRAQALQAAQLACLQNRLAGCQKTDTSDPVYWAGFVLCGAADAVRLSPNHRSD